MNANDNNEFFIDPDQIQVKASSEELNRRIESFIARKREEVNMINIQEFCLNNKQNDNEEENSCARVDAILLRRKDSKSHVKVHRVYNQFGPQTQPLPVRNELEESNSCPPAIEERLMSAEKVLGINKPVPKDIYERIKKIEDRLCFLESVSPEYKDFWVSVDDSDEREMPPDPQETFRKRTFSSTELDSKLSELESRYMKKARHDF